MNHLNTKLLIATISLALLPLSSALAQPERGMHNGPPDAEMRVAHLTRALNLSNEQSAQLLEVFQAVDEERGALREQAMQQMKPQICELRLATENEIQSILSQDQLNQLEDIKTERRKPRHSRGDWQNMTELDCSSYETS